MFLALSILSLLETAVDSLDNPHQFHTLAQAIAAHASERPNNPAFSADTTIYTWEIYQQISDALAIFFIDLNFMPGNRIGILLPDGAEIHAVFAACEKAGLVAVGISARAGEREIAHVLHVSGAIALISGIEHNGMAMAELYRRMQDGPTRFCSHLVVEDPFFKLIRVDGEIRHLHATPAGRKLIQQRKLQADELFLINSTSGTTGMPKCVSHNQRRWLRFADYVHDSAALTAEDVFLCAVPASVGFGLWFGHFVPTLLGATTVLLPKFSAIGMLEAIERSRATVVAAVSTQLVMLLNALDQRRDVDVSSLRIIYTGGEAVPYERAAKLEAISGATILQFYGSNEAGALSYTTCRDSQEKRLRTAGRTIPAMNISLVDPVSGAAVAGCGRPRCKGPLASMGYFNDVAANNTLYTEGGFLQLDDIVAIDDDGYLRVVGRFGDFIIRGGKNISAAAVEESVLAYPSVVSAAAVAMPDSVFGEKVCVYVTLVPAATLTLEELTEFFRRSGVSIESFPERLIVLSEMPRVSGGKVDKRQLREDIRQRLAQTVN